MIVLNKYHSVISAGENCRSRNGISITKFIEREARLAQVLIVGDDQTLVKIERSLTLIEDILEMRERIYKSFNTELIPPSSDKFAPWMKPELSEARNKASFATSPG